MCMNMANFQVCVDLVFPGCMIDGLQIQKETTKPKKKTCFVLQYYSVIKKKKKYI